jgi:hypothetical protein
MLSLKRTLRVGIPAVVLLLGASLLLNVPVQAASCAHQTMAVSFLQKVGLAHVEPCLVLQTENGEVCANIGHHCNNGSGPGKCSIVVDATTNLFTCQCIK